VRLIEGEAMARVSQRIALVCAVAVAVIAAVATAQAQQVYRYVDKDGRVIYSDRSPPSDSKEVQAKRLSPNFIENNDVPVATAQAAPRFPVTLYTFACGLVCQNAEGLLNRRGVPFSTVNVEDQKGAELLMKLTGAQQAPVLQVGDKLVAKGFNEARWTTMLDDAGYPKSPPRRIAAKGAVEAAPPPPAAPPEATQALPVPGGGYPKQ
jgi:glutaredoxin